MKKKFLVVSSLLLCLNLFSQIKFEQGYFIDNNNVKTECLIKNMDWLNNPTMFEYKKTELSETKTASINNVQEFSVSTYKYKRFTIDIDRASEQTNELSEVRNPYFNKETLFLQLVVEGEANLYYYHSPSLDRYFYNILNSETKQLVYKSYVTENNEIKKNNLFKQQLLTNLKCNSINYNEINKIKYKKNDLRDFFIKYNACNGNTSNNISYQKKKYDWFNLNIRPGVTSASLFTANDFGNFEDINFGNKLTPRIGVEAEFVLPFNKNKFAVIIEPSYQYYKSTISTVNNETVISYENTYETDYKSLEIGFGLRHYLFLNDDSKLFANISFIRDLPLNSTVRDRTDIVSTTNYALGLGYNFSKKYSVELRYFTKRDPLAQYTYWLSEYKAFSLILGYNIF